MKSLELLRFEAGYQVRRWWTWLYIVVTAAFCFWITTDDYLKAASAGAYHFNSPFVIASITLLGSVVGMLMAATFAGEAGARDAASRMDPLVYTSSIAERSYVWGRFGAAFLLSAFSLVGVQAALLASVFLADVPADILDAVRIGPYLGAYALIALPNAFLATVILFSLSLLSRRAAASFLGAVIIVFVSLCCWIMLAETMGQWEVAKLIDPLGLTLLRDVFRSTTPGQKNTLEIWSYSSLLLNRAIWLGVSAMVMAFTQMRFRFQAAGVRTWWRRTQADERSVPITAHAVVRTSGLTRHLEQFAAITTQSFRDTALSWGGLALAILAVILAAFGPLAMPYIGVPVLPTTERMTDWIGHPGDFLWFVVPILTTFFAGELVWRDRETRMSDIADAAPMPEWVQFAGRFAGLSLTLLAYQVLLVVACMLIQARMGYYHFELDLYGRVLGLSLTEHLLFAALAFSLHVMINQKYAGYLIVIGIYARVVLGPPAFMNHRLAAFASSPRWTYSDMRGFGPSLIGWMWLKSYWAAWAFLLCVIATLLWVRGRESGFKARLRLMRERVSGRVAGILAATCALILATGGFAFYNLNILNPQVADDERASRYEQQYAKYSTLNQPELSAISLRVELMPSERKALVHGRYTLVNASNVQISSVHFLPGEKLATSAAVFDRPARAVVDDKDLAYRVYELSSPLAPGDSLHVSFDVGFNPRGFGRDGIDASVTPNGTYFEGQDWLPHIAYDRSRELREPGDRKRFGLGPHRDVASLDDTVAVRAKLPRPIALDAIISTDPDEIAVAPGELERSWSEGGRRFFHYATSTPIPDRFAIYSARYATREAKWNDVAIQVLYHAGHATNVDALVRSAKASLDYGAKHIGPYPYRVLRLVEQPGHSTMPLASPTTIAFEEAFAGLNPAADERKIDFVFAVTAHEIAHQWWGTQFAPADVEGAPMLTESLAWLTTTGVVAQSLGEDHLTRLLAMMHESRWTVSSRAHPPWMRMSSWFVSYRHGVFPVVALRAYVGEAQVTAAAQRLFETHKLGATTRDLYAELKAVTPDSLQTLLGDLFERNIYWELETKHVTSEPAANGQWRVTLDVTARKVSVDLRGTETEVPMNDLVEIGVYGADDTTLYRSFHRLKAGAQRVSVLVASKPARAGIDPRNLLIEEEPADNVKSVSAR